MVINTKLYIWFLFSSIISVELALPHIAGVRSVYLVLFSLFGILLFLVFWVLPKSLQIIVSDRYTLRAIILGTSYYSFCLLTFFWSDISFESVFHSTVYLLAFFFVIGSAKFQPEYSLYVFKRITIFLIILSWILLFLDPVTALQQKGIWRLRGVFFHEFELGFLCATLLIIYTHEWFEIGKNTKGNKSLLFLFIVGCVFITLLATQTRTLLLYTSIVVLTIITKSHSGKRKYFAIFMLIIFICGLLFFIEHITAILSRGDSDTTLSGRTLIWERTMIMASEARWLGHGFGTYISSAFDYIWVGNYRPAHAHNAWMMAYFETGLVGAFLMSFFILSQVSLCRHVNRIYKKYEIPSSLLLLATLGSLTSLIYGGKLSLLSLMPMMICVQMIFHHKNFCNTQRRERTL